MHRPTKWTLMLALIALTASIGCDRMSTDTLVTPEPELTETLIIGPYTETCYGAFEQECYLEFNEEHQAWFYFYEAIVGFDYEPGFIYTLKTSLSDRGEGIQDVGRYEYRLVAVISKVAAPTDERPPRIP